MFDSEFLKKLEYLSLMSRQPFKGESFAGHRNAKLGGGVEFASYRDYVPGDDLRHLDWNIYARLGATFIKRFQDVGDIHVYCCLDVSRSMEGTTSTKLDYAKHLLAALAYISLANDDIVSILPFSDHLGGIFRPVRGKGHFMAMLNFLEGLGTTSGRTDFATSFHEMLAKIKTPGLVVVLSDGYDPNGLSGMLNPLLYHHFEPMVIQVIDPIEASPELRGDYRLMDRETGVVRTATIDEAILKKYRARFRKFLEGTKQDCVSRRCRYYAAPTDLPFDDIVLQIAQETVRVKS